MTHRTRRFCLTLNHWTLPEMTLLLKTFDDGICSYLVLGEELAPTTLTPHLQGYLETTTKRTLLGLKKLLGIPRIHLETAIADSTLNLEYCSKGEKVTIKGEPMKQGMRTDMGDIVDAVKSGLTIQQIATKFPSQYIKFHNGIRALYEQFHIPAVLPPRFALDEFKVPDITTAEGWSWERSLIIWGAPGIGKTSYAHALLPNALIVSHIDDLQRYNSTYDGIIFDDMDFIHFPRTSQIHILDNAISRSIHNRFHNATIPAGTKKIFTTNSEGGQIFSFIRLGASDHALIRRAQFFEMK